MRIWLAWLALASAFSITPTKAWAHEEFQDGTVLPNAAPRYTDQEIENHVFGVHVTAVIIRKADYKEL